MKGHSQLPHEHLDTILIVEPNELLKTPYTHLDNLGTIHRVPTVGAAIKEIVWNVPAMVFLSASIDPKKSLVLLDTLKDASRYSLIPLIIVIDLTKEISMVLGTSWGGKIAVVDAYIPRKDLISTISRIS